MCLSEREVWHTHTHTHTHTLKTHTYTHPHITKPTHTHTHTLLNPHTHTHTPTRYKTHTHTPTHKKPTHAHTHTLLNPHIHTHTPTLQYQLEEQQHQIHTKWNSHNTIKHPQYKVTLMYIVHFPPRSSARLTWLQNKVTTQIVTVHCTPLHFSSLHSKNWLCVSN
jgi:hypothetical protein